MILIKQKLLLVFHFTCVFLEIDIFHIGSGI